MEQKTPWYLKKNVIYFFCIVTPPIGYFILVVNLNKFEQQEKTTYLTIATIMMAIWLLKFLPEQVNNLAWTVILTLLIGSTIIKLVKNRKS